MGCGDSNQYVGNRGIRTQIHSEQYFAYNLSNHATSACFDKLFISPAFHISASRENFFYGQDGGANWFFLNIQFEWPMKTLKWHMTIKMGSTVK